MLLLVTWLLFVVLIYLVIHGIVYEVAENTKLAHNEPLLLREVQG